MSQERASLPSLFQKPSRLPGPSLLPGLVVSLILLAGCAAPPPQPAAPVETIPPAGVEAGVEDDAAIGPVFGRPPVASRTMMVASAHPLASQAGMRILREGGNATDAAIAMQLVLGLVEPQSSGLGGGGFLLHFDASTGEIIAHDGRETAPMASGRDHFLDFEGRVLEADLRRFGGISVAVPGTLAKLYAAHRAHGRKPWPDLFEPAIRLAEDGFPVSPRLHESIRRDPYLGRHPSTRGHFFDAAGAPLAPGTLLTNPAFAETLRAVAVNGIEAFYRGPLAAAMEAAVRDDERPGTLTMTDLAAYRAERRPQLCGPYRIWLVCGFGPPSGGGFATLSILAMLERFNLPAMAPGSVEISHLLAEATRLAEADRLHYIADPDHAAIPLMELLAPGYISTRSDMILPERALPRAEPGILPKAARQGPLLAGSPPSPHLSTTHLSVIDGDGNAVALTSSVGSAFGARIMVGGFLLNNHMTDFSFEPEDAAGTPRINRVEPGKRPRSAQSPTLVFDGSGRLSLVLGSPGGPRIIPYVVKTLIGILDGGLDAQTAIDLPNLAVRGDSVIVEEGASAEALMDGLRALGHRPAAVPMASGLQVIHQRDGRLEAGVDPRREGVALGD